MSQEMPYKPSSAERAPLPQTSALGKTEDALADAQARRGRIAEFRENEAKTHAEVNAEQIATLKASLQDKEGKLAKLREILNSKENTLDMSSVVARYEAEIAALKVALQNISAAPENPLLAEVEANNAAEVERLTASRAQQFDEAHDEAAALNNELAAAPQVAQEAASALSYVEKEKGKLGQAPAFPEQFAEEVSPAALTKLAEEIRRGEELDATAKSAQQRLDRIAALRGELGLKPEESQSAPERTESAAKQTFEKLTQIANALVEDGQIIEVNNFMVNKLSTDERKRVIAALTPKAYAAFGNHLAAVDGKRALLLLKNFDFQKALMDLPSTQEAVKKIIAESAHIYDIEPLLASPNYPDALRGDEGIAQALAKRYADFVASKRGERENQRLKRLIDAATTPKQPLK